MKAQGKTRSANRRRLATIALPVILSLVLSLGQGLIPGTKVPTVEAHNLPQRMVYVFFDKPTQTYYDQKLIGWTPGTPLLAPNEVIGLVIKAIPRDGTTTGVGGYIDFYIPNGVQVLDAAYLQPNASGGFTRVPMKGQSLIAIGDGPIGAKTTAELNSLSLGPNILGVTEKAVDDVTNLDRGTIAGVYGDTGIFYSTRSETAWESWTGGPLTNNRGITMTPKNKWDAEQELAFGSKSPTAPIVDPEDGRGNAPWGMGSAVAGPQSGYAWEFNKDYWDANPGDPSRMKNSIAVGPWNRIRYPGSLAGKDQAGLKSTELGTVGVDASTFGHALSPSNPLPPTWSQTNETDPKAIRWSVGLLKSFRPEYVWVQFKVLDPTAIVDPTGCPRFNTDAFGGDAGGSDNGKDHIWRYYDPTTFVWNGCLALGKPASREIVAVGDTYQYTIRVYNLSTTQSFANVKVTDLLPSGVQFISSVPAPDSGPNPLVWNNIGSLPSVGDGDGLFEPGEGFKAVVTVKATSSGLLENTLTVTTPGFPDQTVTEQTPTGAVPFLAFDKTVNPTSVAPGGTVEYTVLVDNIGTGATGSPVQITERLAPGFTYVSKTSVKIGTTDLTASTTVNAANPNQPVFTVPQSIPGGQRLKLVFTAQVGGNVEAGSYCNVYTVTESGVPQSTGALACVNVGGASIGDFLFRDWNGDGAYGPTDEPLPNVTVNLYSGACTSPPTGTPIKTTTTDVSGAYLFEGLDAGTYCVETEYPPGYTVTADPDGGANGWSTVTLATEEKRRDIDFGFLPGGTGVIGDKVFDDVNENGIFDAGDVGINGATVYLYVDKNGNGVIDPDDYQFPTTTTAGSGDYAFTGLAEDVDYLVKVIKTDPAIDGAFADPYVASTPLLIPVPSLTGTFDEADFGFYDIQPSTINGTVCIDDDNDGTCTGADTPLPNVEVRLYKDTNGNGVLDPGEPLLDTTNSNGSGDYTFTDLSPGDYIVDVVQTDPDVPGGYAPSQDQTPVSILTGGTTINDIDFPFVQLLVKAVDKVLATGGETIQYTLYPTYPGSELLKNVFVWDPIPDGTTYASVGQGGSYDGLLDRVTWDLGSSTNPIPGETIGAFLCPASITIEAGKDTWIAEKAGDQAKNYGADNRVRTANNPPERRVGLLHMDLSSLPSGVTIQQATLKVTVAGGGGTNRQVELRELNTNWNEGSQNGGACAAPGYGATWDDPNCTLAGTWAGGGDFDTGDYKGTPGDLIATLNPTSNGVTHSADLTSEVQSWYATPANNRGLVMLPVGTATNEVQWYTRTEGTAALRPQVEITYLEPNPGGCPGTLRLYPTQDAYIQQENPTAVKNDGELRVKWDDKDAVDKLKRSLLQFDVSALPPGATINSADLYLNVTGAAAAQTVGVRAVTSSWNEAQVTWLSRDKAAAIPWTTAGGDYDTTNYGSFSPSATGYLATPVDIQALVQGWYNGSIANQGMILVPTAGPAGGEAESKFASSESAGKEPYIDISYISPYVEVDLVAVQDTFIDADKPNDNLDSSELRTKYDSNTAKRKRTLVQFDLAGLPAGVTIQSADLYMSVKQAANHTNNIRRLISPWNETQATWNSRLTGTPWTTAGGDFAATAYGTFTPSAVGYQSTSVTSLAQYWYANSASNYGLILIPASGSNSEAKYDSSEVAGKEPFLRLRYQAPSAGGTRDNRMSAWPTLVNDAGSGAAITVRMTLRSENPVSNATPGTLSASGANGAGVNTGTCTGPVTITDANITGWGDPAIFEWTCTATAGGVPGSVTLSADASGDAGGTTWPPATTNSVLVSPPLTFQVTVDSPNTVAQVENTGNIQAKEPDTIRQFTPDVCYAAADEATDHLYSVVRLTGVTTSIGNTGTTMLEGMAFNLAGDRLYTANGNTLGTLDVFSDPPTGAFTALPNVIADGANPMNGSLGAITTIDVDTLAFDPATGVLYAVHRREAANTNLDVLFQISPATGKFVPNAFGPGKDYVVIQTNTLSTPLYDVDGIGFNPATGDLYAVANTTAATVGVGDRLIKIDKITGAVTDIARITNEDGGANIDDMEGLAFFDSASGPLLYGTTGSPPPTTGLSDRFWEIDPVTAVATLVSTLPAAHNDYEALACLPGDYQVIPGAEQIPQTESNPVFTNLPTGSIGDLVWFDDDVDGVKDPGEADVGPGVAVLLYEDTNGNGVLDLGESQVGFTTTDADGMYLFDNLAPGDYIVEVYADSLPHPPAEYGKMMTSTPEQHPVALDPGEDYLDADFGFFVGASIGDEVFHDVNHNGLRDAGEPGIEGVVVKLEGVDIAGNAWSETQVTGPGGVYEPFKVPAGTYTISYDPADGAIPGDLTEPTTPASQTITIAAGEVRSDVDFGLDNSGQIGDLVWNDANGDGSPTGEVGLASVTVWLCETSPCTSANAIEATATDPNGAYAFVGLPDGTYYVGVDTGTVPSGWLQTYDNNGLGTPNEGMGVVTGGGLDDSVDFGYKAPAPHTVSGQVYDSDTTNGIPNATVCLYDSTGTDVLACTTTDPNGDYSFPGVEDGSYIVRVDRDTISVAYDQTFDPDSACPGAGCDDETPVTVSGSDQTGVDFGYEETLGSISGTVCDDADGVGDRSCAGDTPLEGVVVYLTYAGNDGILGTADDQLFTATTDPNGDYTFPGLGPGPYQITKVDPAGYDSLEDADDRANPNLIDVTLAPGDVVLAQDFEVKPEPAAIGDRLWVDRDRDGMQDAGEPGIANVTVCLYEGLTEVQCTVTDAEGRYVFTDVPPGTYSVQVDITTLPDGLEANPTYDEDGAGTPHVSAVTVVSGEEHMTADFGYAWTSADDSTLPNGTGAIGDRFWIDADGDGFQDPGESGIAGVTLKLWSDTNGDGIHDHDTGLTAVTDASGYYIFDNLFGRTYVVTVDATNFDPGGALEGFTQTGDPDNYGEPCAVCDNQTTTPRLVSPGSVDLRADFGYRLEPAPGDEANPGSKIGDQIYFDANADGAYNPSDGDYCIPNVTVTLLDGNGDPIATTTTDELGLYAFPGLPAGEYTVVVNDTNNVLGGLSPLADPDGGGDLQSTVTVNGVSNNLLQDFGFTASGHFATRGLIGDTVFLDSNDNDKFDQGEGLEGVVVELYAAGATPGVDLPITATTTDENGHYYFGDLDPEGTYVVYVDTTTLPGGGAGMTNTVDPDTASPGDSTASRDLSVLGPEDLAADFGYQVLPGDNPNSISGTVWEDENHDGYQDDGEAGRFANVTVVLRTEPDGNIVATTTTDGNGDFSFEGLPDGTYYVDVTDLGKVLLGYRDSDGPNPGEDRNSQDDPYMVTVGPTNRDDVTADFGYYFDTAVGGVISPDPLVTEIDPTAENTVYFIQKWENTSARGDRGNITVYNIPAGWEVTVYRDDTLTDTDTGVYVNGTPPNLGSWDLVVTDVLPTDGVLDNSDNVDVANDTGVDGIPDTGNLHRLGQAGNYTYVILQVVVPAGELPGTYSLVERGSSNNDWLAKLADTATYPPPLPYNDDRVFHDDALKEVVIPSAKVGDQVWLDENDDGIKQPGEPGLPNVDVSLIDPGTDGVCGTSDDVIVQTVTTGGTGNYLFDGVAAGDYCVAFDPATVPSGLTLSTSPPAPFTVPSGGEYLDADLGFSNASNTTAIIGDMVFADPNHNGKQDWGEPGIGGVQVTILYDTNSDGVPDAPYASAVDQNGITGATTVTEPDGTYLFSSLPPGTYAIQVDPINFDPGKPLEGYSVTYGPQSPGANLSVPIVVTGGDVYLNADFGYDNEALVSISDRVWYDTNDDGLPAGEPGIPGVTVDLVDAGGNVVATTTTDENGNFSFDGLPPGTPYTIVIGDAGGELSGLQPKTLDATAGSKAATAGDPAGESFGYNRPGTIGDFVWYDDGDGIPEPGEVAAGGVTVELINLGGDGVVGGGDDFVVAKTTTAPDGSYSFNNLPPAIYAVRVTDVGPDGMPGTGDEVLTGYTLVLAGDSKPSPTAPINLPLGGSYLDADFGFESDTALASVSGTVWNDLDQLGDLDPEEPRLPGVTVALVDPQGNVVATTTTDPTGQYIFPNVPPGDYTLVVTDDDGVLQGFTSTTGGDVLGPITVGTTDLPGNDFGYFRSGYLPTSVLLISFTARWEGDAVKLEWETAFEINLTGFDLLRAESIDGTRTQINDEMIYGLAPDGFGASYDYLDQAVTPGGTYYYWLVAEDASSARVTMGPVNVGGEGEHRLYLPAVMRAY